MGISLHCQRVIDDYEDNPDAFCHDFRKIRSAAACLAWKHFEEENLSFSEAMKLAWRDVKETCEI